MDHDAPAPWFRAKRYGWGWGLPQRWQGWLVLATYVVLQIGAAALFLPLDNVMFLLCTAMLTTGLIAVCWVTGEKPRWRWGEE